MPIVKTSLAMKTLAGGRRLRIRADDRAFRADIHAWVKKMGFRLVEYTEGPVQEAVIEKVDGKASNV
jgi:TusA-related sulfurtransferase